MAHKSHIDDIMRGRNSIFQPATSVGFGDGSKVIKMFDVNMVKDANESQLHDRTVM